MVAVITVVPAETGVTTIECVSFTVPRVAALEPLPAAAIVATASFELVQLTTASAGMVVAMMVEALPPMVILIEAPRLSDTAVAVLPGSQASPFTTESSQESTAALNFTEFSPRCSFSVYFFPLSSPVPSLQVMSFVMLFSMLTPWVTPSESSPGRMGFTVSTS